MSILASPSATYRAFAIRLGVMLTVQVHPCDVNALRVRAIKENAQGKRKGNRTTHGVYLFLVRD
jgi:hypothetical protein